MTDGPGRKNNKTVIELVDITKVYRIGAYRVPALRGINLEIKLNEYLALMGPSGSGKSTLMNILGCLDTPTSGEHIFDGVSVNRLDDDSLAAIRNGKVGFVFQTFNLLPRASALSNVEMPMVYGGVPAADRRRRAEEALDRVGLADRMNHRPNELSGGQRQRVAIARALVNEPEVILADEPTGNLDSRTGEEIIGILRDLKEQGNTIILVTHEENIAENTERIIRLLDGRIVSDERTVK
jgi:putative ABC transport system ATP-binding protein